MKRRPPGFKSRERLKTASTLAAPVPVSVLVGADASDAFQALLGRMARNPGSFVFFSDDEMGDYLAQDGENGVSRETLQIQDE